MIDVDDLDLPPGYRWATAEETMTEPHPFGTIVVIRTEDSSGKPYTQGEADLAVPLR